MKFNVKPLAQVEFSKHSRGKYEDLFKVMENLSGEVCIVIEPGEDWEAHQASLRTAVTRYNRINACRFLVRILADRKFGVFRAKQ
jgi:hypothetical protein